MGPKRTFHLRDIILFVLVLLFVLSVGYKYYEWDTLSKVISISNSSLKSELAKSEENSLYFNTEAIPALEYLYSEEAAAPEDYIDAVEKVRTQIKITKDMDQVYTNLLENNRKKLAKLKTRGMFLIGKPRVFIADFLTNYLITYDGSIRLSEIDAIDNTFLEDFFMASRDMAVSNDFFNKAPQNYNQTLVKYVQTNFPKIGVLEKYTKDDFKFNDEENYQSNNTYGYEILLKYKNYLKSFYLIMKDIASNDLESASYKSTTLQRQAVAINLDYEKLFGEGDDKKNSIRKSNILSIAKAVKASKDFASQGIKEYPLLGKVGNFNGDLALCYSYISKSSGLYNNVTSEYPASTDSMSLIKEISKIEPNTDFVDSLFDFEILKVVTNDENSIKFECLDKDEGRVYKYETIK